MNTAGGGEVGLGGAHGVGGFLDDFGIEAGLVFDGGVTLENGVNGGFSAKSAGGGGEEVAGEAFPVAGVLVDEEDEGVVVFRFEVDAADLVSLFNDALGEEEAHDEDFIIAWSAHEDGERAAIDDDLQGLLDGDEVIAGFSLSFCPAGDFCGGGGL